VICVIQAAYENHTCFVVIYREIYKTGEGSKDPRPVEIDPGPLAAWRGVAYGSAI
jgi:hypothetical protein